MEDVFVTKIHIDRLRHLENIEIILSDSERKHLILTGKNGSGKTSLLEVLKEAISPQLFSVNDVNGVNYESDTIGNIALTHSGPISAQTKFVCAYISASRGRFTKPDAAKGQVKAIHHADMQQNCGNDFLQYVTGLDFILYRAQRNKETEQARRLEKWFEDFQSLLCDIYDCPELQLLRDTKSSDFHIKLPNRSRFGLHEMSDGYTAVLKIVAELLMRMVEAGAESFDAHAVQAIVLIDEIDAHLHVELQRRVLKLLTKLFPNTQFIVATHSPFVITSLENAIVFDLEKKEMLENPWMYSSETVVE